MSEVTFHRGVQIKMECPKLGKLVNTGNLPEESYNLFWFYIHTSTLFRHGKNISYKIEIKNNKIDLHDCHVGVWGEQLSVYPKFHFLRVWRKTVFRLALWGSCKHDVLSWKVFWLDSRESFSYSILYFSNLNFPNIFPRNFTCPTGEWWTKSTNPTTNYISYSPGLSDMTFFACCFKIISVK